MIVAGIAVAMAVCGSTALVSGARRTGVAAPARAAAAASAERNPLLPAAVGVEGLWPEMTVLQKMPGVAPPGFAPLYTALDWQIYRERFGAEADELARKKASAQVEFAKSLIAAAETEAGAGGAGHPGLRRLLLVRAAALSYRSRDGQATAAQAVAEYVEGMDVGTPAQVAGLWTMCDTMARYSAVPKDQRAKYSSLAAKANIQLALELLEMGQLDAAQSVIKMLGRHETAVRAEAGLRANAANARALVAQTAAMMDYLGERCAALNSGDISAAMPLYLYARFVNGSPALVAEVLGRAGKGPVRHLEETVREAERDVLGAYAAGEALRTAGADLPEGLLRNRVLYAAVHDFSTYLHSPETERERVKRTLARMALQATLSDGARAAAVIRPFAPPAAARPATGQAPAGPAMRGMPATYLGTATQPAG